MDRDTSSLRLLADRLAHAARSEGGAELLNLLGLAGLGAAAPAPEPRQARTDALRRVGIWEEKLVNGRRCFVRAPDTMEEWPYWASVGRIEPKHTQWRVVFLGESVARGWAYDPFHTPARVLQTLLNAELGKDSVEVVDLARTDMATEVKDLAIEAAALAPDAVAIFAGNNWSPGSGGDRIPLSEIEEALRSGGVPGLKRLAERRLAAAARSVTRTVAEFYEPKGVPVVWVVPEHNLADWVDPRTMVPHLMNGANEEWLHAAQAAEQLFESGDLAGAATCARHMVDLDEGVVSHSLALLARCRHGLGELAESRALFERARDAQLWDWVQRPTPRTYSVTQDVLREQGNLRGNFVVDLPRLFAAHTPGELPGRRLFLDYCHLTAEGMHVAMAATSARLVQALTGAQVEASSMLRRCPVPPSRVLAEGALLSAVHNAHWAQPVATLERLCAEALTTSLHVAELMREFIDLQSAEAPSLMSRAAEKLPALSAQTSRYMLEPSARQLDASLLTAMSRTLEKAGIPTDAHLRGRWRERHSVARRSRDLLSFYYLASVAQPQETFWKMTRQKSWSPFVERDYYRAYWVESAFAFVGEAGSALTFHLTWRTPDVREAAETIEVHLNGACVARLPATRRWSSEAIRVAPENVRDGINHVSIRWPVPRAGGRYALERAADHLAADPHRALFPIPGEVHAFTVAASPRELSPALEA